MCVSRYTCNAGYTSEMSSASAYERSPCVLCDTTLPASCKNTTSYRPATAACGTQNNYKPYSSNCFPCARDEAEPSKYIFYNNGQTLLLPSSAKDCLALCSPQGYHSFRVAVDGTRTLVNYPIPRGELECDPCNMRPGLPCGSTCSENFYLYSNHSNFNENNSSSSSSPLCLPCNMSSCGLPNYYREKCWAGFERDAQCIPCDDRVLLNTVSFLGSSSSSSSLAGNNTESSTYVLLLFIYCSKGVFLLSRYITGNKWDNYAKVGHGRW